MNNHTMNVIRGGKEYEVYQIPIWDIDQRAWFFKGTEEGVHLLAKLCTPVPAETAHEKARRLWEEWGQESPTPPDDERARECFHRANKYINALLAEIDRLKSDAWTEEDLWWISFETIAIYAEKGGWRDGAHNKLRDIISARRAAKAKE
jgi:hypothetical protein